LGRKKEGYKRIGGLLEVLSVPKKIPVNLKVLCSDLDHPFNKVAVRSGNLYNLVKNQLDAFGHLAIMQKF